MLMILLAASLAQAPTARPAPPPGDVVVVVTRSDGLPHARSWEYARVVAQSIAAAGAEPIFAPDVALAQLTRVGKSPLSCRGSLSCIASLGQALNARMVVAVEAGNVMGEVALRVLIVDSTTAKKGSEQRFIIGKDASSLRVSLHDWAEETAKQIVKTRPARQKIVEVTPEPATDVPVRSRVDLVPREAGTGEPRVGAWVASGVAVAGLAGAAVLGVLAFQQKAQLDGSFTQQPSGPVSRLTYPQAQQLRDGANLKLGLGGACAATAFIAASLALYWFTHSEEPAG